MAFKSSIIQVNLYHGTYIFRHTHTFALLLLLDHIVVILLFNKLLLAGRMWLIMAQVLEG
jgi:hypothetical protein